MAGALAQPGERVHATKAATRRRGRLRLAPLALQLVAALVAGLMLLPLGYLIVRAAEAGQNVLPVLLRARTLELLVNSAGLALAVTAGTIALAVPLAWLTVRTDLPGRRVWSVLTSLPLVIPSYVGALVFVSAFGPRGLFQQLLEGPFGIERLPEIYGFFGAWLTLTLFTYPFVLLTVRAGLHGLDPALEEAARSLGEGPWATFWRVTLPQLRPSIAAGALLAALYTISDFGVVSLLQFDTFTRSIYTQYQASFDRTSAAVLGLVLVALTGVILALEAASRGRARYHRSAVGAARQARPLKLGRWTGLAVGFVAAVVVIALILPIGILLYWFVRGIASSGIFYSVWQASLNSLLASSLAAVFAVLAALPVAVLAAGQRGRLARFIEQSTYLSYALPGIVIALALVFFGVRVATPIYQTLVLLVLAYVIRFLPQAVGSARSSLMQVNPHLMEAARGLGRSPGQAFARISVPLIWPGLLAGGALVLLTAMKELPITLLLAPIGFRTLATGVWTGTAEGFYAAASIPALLLIVISAVPLFVLTSHREATHRE